jgi:hypothetical protein
LSLAEVVEEEEKLELQVSERDNQYKCGSKNAGMAPPLHVSSF